MSKVILEKQKILASTRNYHFVSIPKAFMDNNLLSTSKKYKIIFIELEDDTKTPKKNKNS